jgi:predicted Rossmann-fold nucleotide-binding protein
MKIYAGIGSRRLSLCESDFCHDIGKWMAKEGWTLKTGACTGADQAFAEGALSGGGKVILWLPWYDYERDWTRKAMISGMVTTRVLEPSDTAAMESVDQYHPNPGALTETTRRLHARNYLITRGCRFVVAYPKTKNGQLGGTGQGIRVAEGLGIDVVRLDKSKDRGKVEKVIYYGR